MQSQTAASLALNDAEETLASTREAVFMAIMVLSVACVASVPVLLLRKHSYQMRLV